jgi:hypothetical protein
MARGAHVLGMLAAALLGGCSDVHIESVEIGDQWVESCHSLDEDGRPTALRSGGCIGMLPGNRVDLLFVVDDGPGALTLQRRLAEHIDEVIAPLREIDRLVDLRVAFVSSDHGRPGDAANPWPSNGELALRSCREHPEDFADGGAACEALCPLPALTTQPSESAFGDDPRPRPWIELADGRSNLPPGVDPEDALRCAALLGESSTGLPAPLSVAARVESNNIAEGEPGFGFFRPGAARFVVPVTAGPDCSMTPAGENAFDPSGDRALWSDPQAEIAPIGTCQAAGALCTDTPFGFECEVADIDLGGALTDPDHATLWPLEDVAGWLDGYDGWYWMRVGGPFQLWALAPIPVGLAEDQRFDVAPAEDPALGLAPVCELDGTPLLPALRLAELAREAPEAHVRSACADDWAPSLRALGEAIEDSTVPSCMPSCVADFDEDEPGLQPECRMAYESPSSDGSFDDGMLPRCDEEPAPTDAPGCWELRTGAELDPWCDEQGFNLELRFRWVGGLVPPNTLIFPTCNLSRDKANDCPDLP